MAAAPARRVRAGAAPMTREQALRTLGLEADATESEIDAALWTE